MQSPVRPKIHLLLVVPSGEQRKDLERAKDVLNASGEVVLVEEDGAADFARELECRVKAASAA